MLVLDVVDSSLDFTLDSVILIDTLKQLVHVGPLLIWVSSLILVKYHGPIRVE